MRITSVFKARFSAIAIMALALLFIWIGFHYGKSRYQIVFKGEQVEGVVVESQTRRAGKDVPVVTFKTLAGEAIVYEVHTYYKVNSYPVGAKVRVFYLPENPDQALIQHWRIWVFPAGCLLLGGLLLLIGFRELFKTLL